MNAPAPGSEVTFSPFLPLTLVALSMVILLAWQSTSAFQQRRSLVQLQDRQNQVAAQAAQAEAQLQSLMMDLLELAKTDEDAQTIAAKYNIKFSPPPPAPGTSGPPATDSRTR